MEGGLGSLPRSLTPFPNPDSLTQVPYLIPYPIP